LNLFQLALANLRASKLASIVNVFLLALGTASIAILLLAGAQLSSALTKNAAGIDLVIGAKGSPLQLVLAGVYHADVPPGNIAASEVARWQSHPSVASAIPLSLGDSHRGFRIVGTVEEYAALFDAKISQGVLWAKPFEAVLGERVAETTGLRVGDSFAGVHGLSDNGDVHEDTRYQIVGIFEASKSVIDGLILTSAESVWLMHSHHAHEEDGHSNGEARHADQEVEHDHQVESSVGEDSHHEHNAVHGDHHLDHDEPANSNEGSGDDHSDVTLETHLGDEVTLLLIQFASPLAALTLPREVNTESALQAASPPFEITRLLQIVGVGVNWLSAFASVLVLGAVLSIFAALFSSLHTRRHDLAILRCLGATRIELFYLLIVEGLILTLAGIAVGLLFAHGGMELLGRYLSEGQGVSLGGQVWIVEELFLITGLLLVGALTAMLPAWQAYSTDVARTLAVR